MWIIDELSMMSGELFDLLEAEMRKIRGVAVPGAKREWARALLSALRKRPAAEPPLHLPDRLQLLDFFSVHPGLTKQMGGLLLSYYNPEEAVSLAPFGGVQLVLTGEL